MSLIVYAYRRDPQTQRLLDIPFDPPQPSLSAGFESWRWKVWGSQAARDLGLTLLGSLADTDLYAEGVDLERLDSELDAVFLNMPLLTVRTGVDDWSIRTRAENIREAVRLARSSDDDTAGVYIG